MRVEKVEEAQTETDKETERETHVKTDRDGETDRGRQIEMLGDILILSSAGS